MSFSQTLWSTVAEVGFKRGLIIVGGCVLVLLGLVGLALSLASGQQTVLERTRPRRPLIIIGSALLMAIGALATLGVGIIIPLGALRMQGINLAERLNWDEIRLGRVIKSQSVQTL